MLWIWKVDDISEDKKMVENIFGNTNLDHEETISVSASDVVDSSEVEWEEVILKSEEVLVSFATYIKKKMSQPLTSYCPFSPTMISDTWRAKLSPTSYVLSFMINIVGGGKGGRQQEVAAVYELRAGDTHHEDHQPHACLSSTHVWAPELQPGQVKASLSY